MVAIKNATTGLGSTGRISPEMPHRRAAAPASASTPPGSTVDMFLNKGMQWLGIASMASFVGPAIVNGAGGALKWTGKKTGAGVVEKAGRGAQSLTAHLDKSLTDIGIGETLSKVTQPVADSTAGMAERFSRLTGIGEWRRRANVRGTERHLRKARTWTPRIDRDALHHTIRPHIEELDRLTGAANIDISALEKAHTGLNGALEALQKAEPQAAAVTGKSAKAVAKLESAVTRAIEHHYSAESWNNVGAAVKNVPKNIAGASVRHGLMQGSWIGMSALSMVSVLRNFVQDIDTLKKMHAALGGSASTVGALFGKVPAPVAQARKHMFANVLSREAYETFGLVTAIKQPRGALGMGLMLGGQMAGSQLIDSMVGNPILDAYTKFNELSKTGQPLGPEIYAAFLNMASKELSGREAVIEAVATQYAAEKATAVDMLREMDNGKLMQRAKAAAASLPVPVAVSVDTSHVDKLQGAKVRPNIGQHTGKLNQSSTAIEQGI